VSSKLACSHLRVDVGGEPAIDGLTLMSTGEHLLVLGAARALFEAAAGLRPVVRGTLLIDGMRVRQGIRAGVAACAPLDPPLPGAWTAFQYVGWSAMLAGHPRRAAGALAVDALDRLQISASARSKLALAAPESRRATVIAAAVATGATTILMEDPSVGLTAETAHALVRTTMRALQDRCSVMFAARVPLESPLALAADEAIVIDGSQVSAQGPPAEIAASERTLTLRVHGDIEAFRRAVEARGARAQVGATATAPAHMRVELGPLVASDLLRIATESSAVVIELRPVARAFS
jgi:ABC-type multidrug transport system ATPase subunit